MTKNVPKPNIAHSLFKGRFGNPSWSHFGRFEVPKGTPKCVKNDFKNEVEKTMPQKNLGSPIRGEVGGSGGGRKEQVLRSWKIFKIEGASTTPFPPGTRPGGGGYLMADASAADHPHFWNCFV